MPPLRIPTAAEVKAAREAKRQKTTDLFQQRDTPIVPDARGSSSRAAATSGVPAHLAGPPHAAGGLSTTPPAVGQPKPPPANPSLPVHYHSASASTHAAGGGASCSSGSGSRSSCGGGSCARGDASSSSSSSGGGSGSAIPAPAVNPNSVLVSRRQNGNPVLRHIRNVPWQFGDTSADYLLSDSTCCLFISLRYHLLHPDYLTRRLRELGYETYPLRVVLLLVDSDDAERPVLDITRTAILHDCTTICAWSVGEAARYLETLKAYAKKPADLIKERTDGAFVSQLGEALTSIRPINKTDVATLHATFGSLAKMMHATQSELALCPGLGQRKVNRLRETFTAPFVPARARGVSAAVPAPTAGPTVPRTTAAAASTAEESHARAPAVPAGREQKTADIEEGLAPREAPQRPGASVSDPAAVEAAAAAPNNTNHAGMPR